MSPLLAATVWHVFFKLFTSSLTFHERAETFKILLNALLEIKETELRVAKLLNIISYAYYFVFLRNMDSPIYVRGSYPVQIAADVTGISNIRGTKARMDFTLYRTPDLTGCHSKNFNMTGIPNLPSVFAGATVQVRKGE